MTMGGRFENAVSRLRDALGKIWFEYIAGLFAIIAIGVGPLLPAMSAKAFGDAHGCNVNEGTIQPCIVDGIDHAQKLHDDFASLWWGVFSVPCALVLFFVWIRHLIDDLEYR